MKRLIQSTLLLAVVLSAVSLHASTVYNIVPNTDCAGSLNDSPLSCIVELTPQLPIGEFPTLNLSDWIETDGHGTVGWSSVKGPTGQSLGAGSVQDNCHGFCTAVSNAQFCSNGQCITDVAAMTVFFEGTYIGGGQYAGHYTVSFTYSYRTFVGGSHEWVRSVSSSGGTVTITE